jgi:hypothetical protein
MFYEFILKNRDFMDFLRRPISFLSVFRQLNVTIFEANGEEMAGINCLATALRTGSQLLNRMLEFLDLSFN